MFKDFLPKITPVTSPVKTIPGLLFKNEAKEKKKLIRSNVRVPKNFLHKSENVGFELAPKIINLPTSPQKSICIEEMIILKRRFLIANNKFKSVIKASLTSQQHSSG